MSFSPQPSKPQFGAMQDRMITFWKQYRTFEKSVAKNPADQQYRFYDGPPFITGTPHTGTLMASMLKDVFPRYQTMKGKRVERVRGRDCHGLPIEEKVQKKLGLSSSLDIEKVGIQTFIDECYGYTRSMSAEWATYVDNIGRRVDFNNSYKTMDNDYMESVMRVFKQLREKGLIYKGKRVSMYSTKLETPISSFEVAMDDTYGEVNDPAITVMFRIDSPFMNPHIDMPVLPEGYDIRLASPEDAEAIQSVRNRSWIQTYVDDSIGVTKELIQARFDKNRERNVQQTRDDIEHGKEMYVATYQGEIIGIKRHQYQKDTHREYGGMYILSDHHSKGLGRALNDISLAGCGHMDLSLDVHAGNTRAISFYEKLGFVKVEGSEQFHEISEGKGFDLITMVKKSENPLYALARTTTPWTMPCNIALAVNQEKIYTQVRYEDKDFIVAKARVEEVFKGKEIIEIRDIAGSALVGLSYQAPFDYFQGKTGNTNDHNIYHADFITDTDGTGIGHEAPEFGEVDFQLAKKVGLTITEAMNNDGTYSEIMQDLSGHFYRDMNDEMVERLRQRGLLFAKSSITHRVAFCPRSGTPLVYKAQDSWFIDIQRLKPRLLEMNEQINRYPEHLKHGRFAKSMESAPDRCISRTRYRGTPMPVYTAPDGTMKVVGSRDELFTLNKPFAQLTRLVLVRHGRTDYNDVKLTDHHNKARLTDLGKNQADTLREIFADQSIDVIYCSPFHRCLETITPLAEAQHKEIITDDRLREFDHGQYQDKQFACELLQRTNEPIGETGEAVTDIYERVRNFIHEVVAKHPGQTVAICTHAGIVQMIGKVVDDYDFNKAEQKAKRTISNKTLEDYRPKMAYVVGRTMKNLDLHRPTIDEILVQDPETQQTLHRIPEVLDCWMESASMPYGQVHYPFENKQKFDDNFPADFVVEYTGQIRARFYVMHVLGVALFDKPAFRNVLCTGVMAGNDGRKMSKSYGNFTDPKELFQQYGGDVVRMTIMNSPVVYGGDVALKDEMFVETIKKALLPLWNSFGFFVTYANIDNWTPPLLVGEGWGEVKQLLQKPTNLTNFLDKWMVAELDNLIQQVELHLSSYAVHRASDSVLGFLDLLTNWYIRRSRRRFRASEQTLDKQQAYETLYYVLVTLCQVIAPMMPFVSELIWKSLTAPLFGLSGDEIRDNERSVHLTDRPVVETSTDDADREVAEMMRTVRSIVSAGLAWRSRRTIRVRQPLSSLTLSISLDKQYLDIIAEELNIKSVLVDLSLTDRVQALCKPNARLLGPKFGKQVQELIVQGKQGNFTNLTDGRVQIGDAVLETGEFEIDYVSSDPQFDGEVVDGLVLNFDATITSQLALEGYARDLIRLIQDARKEADYDLADRIQLLLDESLGLVEQFGEMIMEETLSTIVPSLETPDITKTVELGGQMVGFGLKR